MFLRRPFALLWILSVASCVSSVPEADRPCPCSAGWSCCFGQCEQVAVCPTVVAASSGGSSSGGASSSGGGSTTTGSSSSGGGTAALSGPSAFPVDYVFITVSPETAAGTELNGIATVEGVLSSASLLSWAIGLEATICDKGGAQASWDVSARAVSLYVSENVPLLAGTAYTDGVIYLDQLLPDGGSETLAGAYMGADGPLGSSSVTFSVVSDLEVAGTFSADMVQADGGTTTIAGSFDSVPYVPPECQEQPTTDGGCGAVTCPTGCDIRADCSECIPESSTAGAGSACATTVDCCTGTCVNDVCTSPGGSSSSGGTSTSTSSGGSSTGGTSSSGGTGAVQVGGACTTSSDCSSEYCASGSCACNGAHPAAPYSCKSDSDCCAPVVCTAGYCVAPTDGCQAWTTDPNPTYDASCNPAGGTADVCSQTGVCIPNCNSETDYCATGETCDVNGHCSGSGCLPLQTACVLDQDCCNTSSPTSWTLCYGGACCVAAYAECSSSADCCSGSCTGGACDQCDGGICGA